MCNITIYQGGGEGVRGLAPWSWSTFWVSRCQMSNFKTLWSIKLHFASRWTKSEEIDVAFCFLKSKVVSDWLYGLLFTNFWTLVYQVALWSIKLHLGLSSCTLVYKVELWSIKLHLGLSSCILVYQVASLVYQVAFWSIKLHLASQIKLHFGLSSCILVYQVAHWSIKLHLGLSVNKIW